MLDSPRIAVCYTVVSGGPISPDYCARFVGSWLVNPPGANCDLIAICNGGPLDTETALMFSPIPCRFFPRQNDEGWDMSGYAATARQFSDYDLHVYLGESCYFWKPGWLARIVEAWRKFGEGMYGLLSSHLVRPHLNTTAFSVSPRLMNGYPRVTNHRERYGMEHGENSFWKHLDRLKFPVRFVTWDGFYPPGQWRSAPNILWRGDQSNLLIRCNHVDRYEAADERTRRHWAAGADSVPRR